MLEIVSKYIDKEIKEKEQILLDYFRQNIDLNALGYKEMLCEGIKLSSML